jgi:hypothetical protein
MDRPASNIDGDRERISRARQAAEELFKPKRQPTPAAAVLGSPNARPEAEQPARRQPRIIMVAPLVPIRAPSKEAPAKPARERRRVVKHERPRIPESQFGRIRALANYGMTRAQVAKLYGVPVSVIDRIVGADEPE